MVATKTRSPLVPDVDITINGSPLPVKVEPYLSELTVDIDTELPSMFKLEIAGIPDKGADIPWIDEQNLFTVGDVVEIKLGYGGKLSTLIIGEVTSLEPEFTFHSPPKLIVRGYDRRHRLLRGRKTRTFLKQKDSDIAAQIASEAGLSCQATDTQVVHDYLAQVNQTDMEFLQERARRLQYEILIQDKNLIFRPVANAESAVITLDLDDDLLEFYPRLSTIYQINEIKIRGWNSQEKKEIIGQAKKGAEVSRMGGKETGAALAESKFGQATLLIGDRPVLSQAEADQFAKAKFNNIVLDFIIGEGICCGRTDLIAGKVIKIDGIGKRFSGEYYVTSAIHYYSSQAGYQTRFTVQRNAL